MDSINSKIIWLSGPSSSGKTYSTKSLEEKGWIRLEADFERAYVEVALLKKDLLDDCAYLESHFPNPEPATIINAIWGGIKPVKRPDDPIKYENVRLKLLDYIKKKNQDVSQDVLIHMLNKAIELSALGKSVILDHVPFVNDPGFSSHEVTRDFKSLNLWCYKNIKIEQQLKYVPVEILMRNVMQRNQSSEDHRSMPMVLKQYAERFKTSTSSDEERLGKLSVESLKKWVERAVKIDFFDINPNHGFKYDAFKGEDIDSVIQKRLEQFDIELNNPETAIDPCGESADADTVELLNEKKAERPNLQKKINDTVKDIMEVMKIPEAAIEVDLTYISISGIKPTIVSDTKKEF